MKKALSIILTAVMVMTLLTGCGCVRFLLDIASDDTVEENGTSAVNGTNQSGIAQQAAGQPDTNSAGVSGQQSDLAGIAVTDDSGNTVTLGSIISNKKVTLINFWATYCDSCIDEMPTLNRLNNKYSAQGFQVIGVTSDVLGYYGDLDSEMVGYARDITGSLGLTYPIYNITYELMDYANVYAFPTTLIVDANGNLLTEPIYGAQSESRWESIINEALSKTN